MLSSGDLDLRSGIRDFFFLLEAGLRDLGAGVRSLGSGVAGFGFPHPGSIYTYSRSTTPAAVMLWFIIKDMAISILFFVRNGTRDNFFELFAKVFRRFRPRGNFFDGPKNFQILADSAAIRLVQKSSKSCHPRDFSAL